MFVNRFQLLEDGIDVVLELTVAGPELLRTFIFVDPRAFHFRDSLHYSGQHLDCCARILAKTCHLQEVLVLNYLRVTVRVVSHLAQPSFCFINNSRLLGSDEGLASV